MSNSKSISFQDVGPIRSLVIELPEPGGVATLLGRNGSGKTRALEATKALLAGKGPLEARDGSLGGKVIGLGCTITVGKRTGRTGELEVMRLEGGDPSRFVSPGLNDPAAADAVRIAELCRLAKVEVDLAPFAALVGGDERLRELAAPATLLSEDMPSIAQKLKRDLEAAARKVEGQEENERGRAHGLRQGLEGIDLGAQSGERELAAVAEAAVRDLASVEAKAKERAQLESRATQAREALERAASSYSGPTVAEAEEQVVLARQRVDARAAAVEEAKRALAAATSELRLATQDRDAAVGRKVAAEEHEAAIAGWRRAIEQTVGLVDPGEPFADQIVAARERVEAARRAQETGAVVRDALARRAKADEAARTALALGEQAKALRGAAAACWDVLSAAISAVAPAGLRVLDGRLVLPTGRGDTYFSDLSDGERWRIGLDVAVEAGGEGCLIPIEQIAWEGLDPQNRRAIAEHARDRGVVVLTAECDDGELRAEVFAS